MSELIFVLHRLQSNGFSPAYISIDDIIRQSADDMSCKNCKRKLNEISATDGNSEPIKKQRLHPEHDLFNSMVIPELAIKIFSYLRYKDLLLSAALVCRRWDGLSRAPELWRTIDLTYESEVTTETVEKLLKRSQAIKRVSLYECTFIRDSVVSEIAKQQKLETLCLARCYQLSPEIFSSVAKCSVLRNLDLGHLSLTDDDLGMIAKSCTNLVVLNVDRCGEITTKGLLPVIQHCTQLRKLYLAFCKKVTDEFLFALATKPSQIECLFIDGCNFTADGLKYLRKLKTLKQLEVSSVSSVCDSSISMFSNLSYLGIGDTGNITNVGVSAIVDNNPSLEILDLSDCESINDSALEMISKSSCQSTLKALGISNSPISELGISLILQNCAKLVLLIFSKIAEETVNNWRIDYPRVELMLS